MSEVEPSIRPRLAEAVMVAVRYSDGIELGFIPRPYSEAIKRIVAPYPWMDDSENRLGFVYLVLVEAVGSVAMYADRHHWLGDVAEAGSFAYVALYISNAGPFAAMEYYRFNYSDESGWRVQRPKLPSSHPFQPNARRFRRWCKSNGIVLLGPEVLDMPIALLGPPVPSDATGVVHHWLFGIGADAGPEYGHVVPLVCSLGKPVVEEYLRPEHRGPL